MNNGILIYKIFDCLMNAYPTLKNFYKAGYNKEVCIGLFTKMKHTDLINENYAIPGRIKGEEKKKVGKSATRREQRRNSRVGSEMSIKSMRSSVRSQLSHSKAGSEADLTLMSEKNQTFHSGNENHMTMSRTSDEMESSRISNDGRQTMMSYKILPPTEKLGFNLYPDQEKNSKLTKVNLNPEKTWQKRFTNPIKPIYQGEIDAAKNVFQRMAEREMREKRVYSFMTKTGKEMDEISKKDRADLMKKMIK